MIGDIKIERQRTSATVQDNSRMAAADLAWMKTNRKTPVTLQAVISVSLRPTLLISIKSPPIIDAGTYGWTEISTILYCDPCVDAVASVISILSTTFFPLCLSGFRLTIMGFLQLLFAQHRRFILGGIC